MHQDLGSIKQCLDLGFPVILGIQVYDSFESQAVAETGLVPALTGFVIPVRHGGGGGGRPPGAPHGGEVIIKGWGGGGGGGGEWCKLSGSRVLAVLMSSSCITYRRACCQ